VTDYKVGQRVKIGEWEGEPFVVGHFSTGDVVYFHEFIAPAATLDLMGATVVPEPIEWQYGDTVQSTGYPGLLRRTHSGWVGLGGTAFYTDDYVTKGVNSGAWQRVAVTPLDS
jgi:hypothetical protein